MESVLWEEVTGIKNWPQITGTHNLKSVRGFLMLPNCVASTAKSVTTAKSLHWKSKSVYEPKNRPVLCVEKVATGIVDATEYCSGNSDGLSLFTCPGTCWNLEWTPDSECF